MRRAGEDGFALISAVWLLTLAAAIAALLMLQSLRQSRQIVAVQSEASAQQNLDDILARIASAILFEGPASAWGRAPAQGQVNLAHGSASVSVEREALRLDVNKAGLADIDNRLHDEGFLPEHRAAILARISEARAAHRLIGTFADVLALGHGILPADRNTCLSTLLSPFGDAQASQKEGNDLIGSPIRAGDALRVIIAQSTGRQVAVLRLLGTRDEPYSVLDWYQGDCAGAPAA